MKDRSKPAYDRHGEQAQSGISRRVRNDQVRLDRLLARRILKPSAPLLYLGAEHGNVSVGPAWVLG
jgi:hypothetical protein